MAPIEQDSDPDNGKIKNIADLDSASTFSRAEFVRSPSYNNTSVYREAISKANFITENDDLISSQPVKAQKKLNPKNVWEDGSSFAINLGTDIQCLGGVDHDIKKSQDISGLKSLNRNPATASPLRTWRSSGMGKKRKKAPKKKHSKRQKTTILMTSTGESIETLDCINCSDSEASSADEADDVKVKNKMKNCTITAGHEKNKTGGKGGCVNTQTACGAVNGNKKACYSPAERCRGGGAGGGGDDGDDERGKPPRKPPDHTAGSKSSKKKKTRTGNELTQDNEDGVDQATNLGMAENEKEMVSAQHEEHMNEQSQPVQPSHPVRPSHPGHPVQPCQPVQPSQQEQRQKFLVTLSTLINHSNYCKVKSCKKCQWVQAMFMHSFEEMNGTCKCHNCLVWFSVLKFHAGICQCQDCKVCQRSKKTLVKPTATATVVQRNELNLPTCGPSLDQDDVIVWKDKSFPQDVTHFMEDRDYILSQDCLDKGGHGAVFNIHVDNEVKKKYFGSSAKDLVIKMCDKVGKDELYVCEKTSQHPNFVGTYCVVKKVHLKKHGIVMEKCELSLKEYLRKLAKKGKRMEIYECMFYWTQVFDALKYLHHLRTGIPVIHKDVKAENVLLSINDNLVRVKLADYDTVKLLHHEFTQPGLKAKGTLGLISPEVLRQLPHGRPADVWNMGMFLLQLLFVQDFQVYQEKLKTLLNNLRSIEAEVEKFINEKLGELRKMDNGLADLISCCLDDDPSCRPTAVEVLKHPAVTKYTKSKVDMDALIRQIFQS